MKPVYDDFARHYDTLFRPLEKYFLKAARMEAMSFLPARGHILEVGAGTGANFEHYPEYRNAIATELSASMLGFAHPKSGSICLAQADAQCLPFDANHFDAAFGTLVFCSIPDPAMAFSELQRVVKANGRVVLLEHVRPPGFLGPIFDAVSKLTVALVDDHFNRRTADAASRSGLVVTEVRTKLFGIVNLIVCDVIK